jgi:hypothetical protein
VGWTMDCRRRCRGWRASWSRGHARGGDRGVSDGREHTVHGEAPGKQQTTRRAVRPHLGAVPAAPIGAPHGGEEARDSRSSCPVACMTVADHVAQSRAVREKGTLWTLLGNGGWRGRHRHSGTAGGARGEAKRRAWWLGEQNESKSEREKRTGTSPQR